MFKKLFDLVLGLGFAGVVLLSALGGFKPLGIGLIVAYAIIYYVLRKFLF
jgi:hypothetical protein